MKKILAMILALAMILSLAACGGGEGDGTTPPTDPSKPEDTKSYQFYGKFEETGEYASMLNAAFLLDLNADGTAVCDKYASGTYNVSDVAENKSYTQSYLSGTWKAVEKDGVPCLQIKLAYVDKNGNESNAQTCYAYDVAGTYSFEMTFPVVPGQSYTRTVLMEGKEGKTYNDDNAFIQAYKATFTAPEHVGTFVDAENNGTAYLQADGTLLLYAGYDKFADGKWTKSGNNVTISIGGEAVEVTVEGNKASFVVTRTMGEYTTEYIFVCEDISVLPGAAADPAAPYTVSIDLGGNKTTGELTLNDDGTANLKVFTDIPCTYVKIGKAVVLSADKLEGYAATIWGVVKHAYILNEDHSMTPIAGAYNAGQLALIALDDTRMLVQFPAYGMERDGFTYVLEGNNLTITAPSDDVLGAFAQIWNGVGGANWTVDGTTATKVG